LLGLGVNVGVHEDLLREIVVGNGGRDIAAVEAVVALEVPVILEGGHAGLLRVNDHGQIQLGLGIHGGQLGTAGIPLKHHPATAGGRVGGEDDVEVRHRVGTDHRVSLLDRDQRFGQRRLTLVVDHAQLYHEHLHSVAGIVEGELRVLHGRVHHAVTVEVPLVVQSGAAGGIGAEVDRLTAAVAVAAVRVLDVGNDIDAPDHDIARGVHGDIDKRAGHFRAFAVNHLDER